ncbi:hypothetical protein JCM30566_16130 [Marinitoga arctica]
MKKTFFIMLLSLLSISMFAWVKTPILNEKELFEVTGTIININSEKSGRFLTIELKDKKDFKAIFPNAPILEKWFEKDTDITLYGYYIQLKTDKYFIPVKINYKDKTVDLREEISRKLYQKKYYQNMLYNKKIMKYWNPPIQKYPYYYNYRLRKPGINTHNRFNPNYMPKPYNPPIK